MVERNIKFVCFILAAILTLPLIWFALMTWGFCGFESWCILVILSGLAPIAIPLCFFSMKIGRVFLWVLAGVTLIAMKGVPVWWLLFFAALLLQIGDFRPKGPVDRLR